MDLANMYELLNMVHDLKNMYDSEGKPRAHKVTIEDFCFDSNGKGFWVRLSNGKEYSFNVK